MKTKKRRTIHFSLDEILGAAEEDLIQTWRDGQLAAPASPLEAASGLAMRSLMFIKGAKTFPNPPHPSEAEFAEMLGYIVEKYHLSPDFPYSNEQLEEDIATNIQRRLDES
jgi:hypothetical protein